MTGMALGSHSLALTSLTAVIYQFSQFAASFPPDETCLTAVLGITVGSMGYMMGRIAGHIVPGLPIGLMIKAGTYRKRPKPLVLIREQKRGYSIEETMPIKFDREQKGLLPMNNDSTHYLCEERFGKYLIHAEDHYRTKSPANDRWIDGIRGRTMVDIKDEQEGAKKSCMDHLLQEHDLEKAGKVYFQKKGSDQWVGLRSESKGLLNLLHK